MEKIGRRTLITACMAVPMSGPTGAADRSSKTTLALDPKVGLVPLRTSSRYVSVDGWVVGLAELKELEDR